MKREDELYAALKQPFVIADGQAQLEDVRKFLEFNGFENTRRNDYVHKSLGLILEDMHDENVLVNSETLTELYMHFRMRFANMRKNRVLNWLSGF